MAELKLQKRYKYAGDIMPKLLDIGFDLETASDFLNSIPDADVAPRAEVVREIIEDVATLIEAHWSEIQHGVYWLVCGRCIPLRELLKTVEKKYTEGQK